MSPTPPLLELGGTGSPVHLAPANGLPFACYQPIIDAIASRYRVVAVPPVALRGNPPEPPATPGRWEEIARDIVAGLLGRGIGGVTAIGHSFGAVASLLGARHPASPIARLVLLDPTLLRPALFRLMDEGRRAGRLGWHPLVARTRERRNGFSDHEEAFRYFRRRPAFGDWSEEAIWRLVRGGLESRSDGSLRLAWSPEWEAYYYESIDTDAWSKLADLDPAIPVLLVHGAASDTFVTECRDLFAAAVPRATIIAIDGGHLFPQSAPEVTARVILNWLDRT